MNDRNIDDRPPYSVIQASAPASQAAPPSPQNWSQTLSDAPQVVETEARRAALAGVMEQLQPPKGSKMPAVREIAVMGLIGTSLGAVAFMALVMDDPNAKELLKSAFSLSMGYAFGKKGG